MIYKPKQFVERVKMARNARGWSLDKLSRETGLSKTYLWEIERGGKNPSIETLVALCMVFELRADYLLFGE